MLAKLYARSLAKPLIRGVVSSPVRLTLFEDLLSEASATFHREIEPELLRRYQGKLHLEIRTLPDSDGSLSWELAAMYYYLGWILPEFSAQFRNYVYSQQNVLRKQTIKAIADSFLKPRGLSVQRLLRTIYSGPMRQLLERDRHEANLLGISAAPGLIVQGKVVPSALNFDRITKLVQDELKLAQ